MYLIENYVLGKQDVQVPAHLNFGKYILDHLRAIRGDDIAIVNIDTKEELTFKELTQNAVNLAASFIKLGVKPGDVIAVGSEKRVEFLPIILAIVFSGAIYTPYDLQSGRATLKHKINISQPKYFICSQYFLDQYTEIIRSFDCVKKILTIEKLSEDEKSVTDLAKEEVNVELFEPPSVRGQTDVAFILYSSGTTGMPKGVQLTHLNCILYSLPHDFRNESLKVAFGSVMYYNYGTFMTLKFLVSGKKFIFPNDVTADSILRAIHEYQANITFLLPFTVSLLLKDGDFSQYNLDSLQVIYSRTSPLHKKTIDKVKQRFPKLKKILQGYGMTESNELCSESWAEKGPKPGSVGKASPGIVLKVVDLETHKALGPNKRGEICMKGPVLMKGYVGMNLSKDLDEEGFFRTGDLGYYDDDRYFFIVGRLKEIIMYKSFNVAPIELETFLQLHPGVREAGVVGKPVPDVGEEPTAFVVRQPGSDVTEQELVDYIAREVEPYKQLRGGVRFIDEIPRNPRKKILRQKLIELLNES